MKPGESTGELLARITNTMVIIKDSYASYENKPPAPANFDVNYGFTMPVCRQWKDEALNNAQQFLKMQLFRAALTPELRKVVAQRNPNTMTLDDMYQIATPRGKPGPKSNKRSQPYTRRPTMTKSRLLRGERTKTSTERKPPPLTQLPNQDKRGTPATTEATHMFNSIKMAKATNLSQ
jgi:hypothetical protein